MYGFSTKSNILPIIGSVLSMSNSVLSMIDPVIDPVINPMVNPVSPNTSLFFYPCERFYQYVQLGQTSDLNVSSMICFDEYDYNEYMDNEENIKLFASSKDEFYKSLKNSFLLQGMGILFIHGPESGSPWFYLTVPSSPDSEIGMMGMTGMINVKCSVEMHIQGDDRCVMKYVCTISENKSNEKETNDEKINDYNTNIKNVRRIFSSLEHAEDFILGIAGNQYVSNMDHYFEYLDIMNCE